MSITHRLRTDHRARFLRTILWQLPLPLLLLFSQHVWGQGQPLRQPPREGKAAVQQLDGEAATTVQVTGKRPFVVMTFNTGTTPGLQHDAEPADGYSSAEAKLSDRWYGNGLSWRPAMMAVRKMVQEVDPDIVAFQEIFDCQECARDPRSTRGRGFACEDWTPGDANVAQWVLGDDYQIAYHPGKRSKCLAVHRRFGVLRGCQDGDCESALDGAEVTGCGGGARIARAVIERSDGGR